jgi:hypothetical protein
MSTAETSWARAPLLHDRRDVWPVFLAALHGAAVLAAPVLPVLALGLWWNSNTVAHTFLHRPFFRRRLLNHLFALYLTALLGIPQSLWRDRHLAHHAGVPWRFRPGGRLFLEFLVVLSLWAFLLSAHPGFFLTVYLPAYALGLVLCWVQGHYEHAAGTVSHHGLLYNALFLNDGYHVEHHARPGMHWADLPSSARPGTPTSAWPAVLRWMGAFSLEGLERWALRSPRAQRFLVARHEAAFRRLLPPLPAAAEVIIVGGGLFPRTLLALRNLLPGAHFTVIDRSAENLDIARRFLGVSPSPQPFSPLGERGEDAKPQAAKPAPPVSFVHDSYHPGLTAGADVVVFPLAFVGDRGRLYADPQAPFVFVHDWLWRRRGRGAVVSYLLCKRLNRVERCAP